MTHFKFIFVFLLTIIFITAIKFQPVIANPFVPSQLMAINKRVQGFSTVREREARVATESINRGNIDHRSERKSLNLQFTHNPLFSQIYRLYQQGEYQQVIEILSNYQEEDLTPFSEYLAASYENIGQINLAVNHWHRAQKIYAQRKNYDRAGYCLLKLAQGYIDLGRSTEAISLIQNWSYPLPVFADGVLGNAYLVTGKYRQAIASYQKALNNQLNTQQRLTALNNLGSSYLKLALKSKKLAQLVKQKEDQKNLLETAQKASINAQQIREKAWFIAQNHSYPSAIKAKLHWLRYSHHREIIQVVSQNIEQLPSNHLKIQLLISLAQVSPQSEIYLQRALELAEKIEDNLGLAIASAELGKLYEQQQQYQIALDYTEAAEKYIYPFLFYEYLYQYQWQEARIHQGLNQTEKAKSAYQRSLDSLQKIREKIAFSSKETEFDFQESIEPIYRGLLTILLADSPSQSDLQQSLIVFEQFQLAQLENLFADICFEGETQEIISLLQAENMAIITTIVLEDYTYIIALTPDGKYYSHRQKIYSKEIDQKVGQWRLDLEDIRKEKYISDSTFFYNLLFKPFEKIMVEINPNSIIFINDGLLRNVPMAALYDAENQQFLIEKYPISVALGQNFLPSVSPSLANNSLAFGLSKAIPPVNIALPNVETEIKSVQKIIDANTGLNQEFTQENLVEKIKENNLSVLHLASHGEFTGLIENSFIQAYDKVLTTPELEQILIEAERIDLLTLSACETASGDNRAVMGLAGVAIRTGIPAVLSTLWSVSDLTTPKIISDFYQHWQQEKNKARALQKVQIDQIRSSSHPRIWAAFVLIGI